MAVLDPYTVVQLNQYTAAFLELRGVAVLDTNHLPVLLGHGTMVAELIHLVAPAAQIIPLKAFNADGSSSLSNIVRAIFYATDNGAKVINMSFEISQISDELVRTVNYAMRKGVICVASTGNEGLWSWPGCVCTRSSRSPSFSSYRARSYESGAWAGVVEGAKGPLQKNRAAGSISRGWTEGLYRARVNSSDSFLERSLPLPSRDSFTEPDITVSGRTISWKARGSCVRAIRSITPCVRTEESSGSRNS